MTTDLVITKMTETGSQIRTITIPGSGTWYVAKDITDILGYDSCNSSTRIKSYCENYVRFCDISVSLPAKEINKINELGIHPSSLLIQRPDVHRIIVAAKRTKEEAAQFEKWIFEEVLEEVMDTGTYSLPNTNLESKREDTLLKIIEESNLNMKLMTIQHSEIVKLMTVQTTNLIEHNSKMLNTISNFNEMLAWSNFQTAINTAFTLNDYIEFEKYVDIIKGMSDIKIRANFNSVNLRIYLFKNVSENERIFKSTGEPYDKYVSNGFYNVNKSENTKIFITKVGAEHLYWFLKAKKILN